MTWVKQTIAKECEDSPEFKAAYEEEKALLALARAQIEEPSSAASLCTHVMGLAIEYDREIV